MKQLLVLFVMLIPFSSHAIKWVERGNGGFVLKCDNSERRQTFDLYEADQRGQAFDGNQMSSVEERMQYLLGKVEKINPSRAMLYRGWYSNFIAESQFLANVELSPVPDIGLGIKPKNCTLELAVFQRAPDAINKKRYVISLDLWNSLDVANKSALIMHEIIYRELIETSSSHQTSESTRYFNGVLNSAAFADLSLKDYLTLLQDLRFPTADFKNFSIRLAVGLTPDKWNPIPLKFYENGNLSEAFLVNEGILGSDNLRYLKCLPWDTTAEFYPHGGIAKIQTHNTYYSDCVSKYNYQEDRTEIRITDQSWWFDQNGKVTVVEGEIDFGKNNNSIIVNGVRIAPAMSYSGYTFKVALRFSQDKLAGIELEALSSVCLRKNESKLEIGYSRSNAPLILKTENLDKNLAAFPLCKN